MQSHVFCKMCYYQALDQILPDNEYRMELQVILSDLEMMKETPLPKGRYRQ
jgi:hypothetical protein